MNRLLVEIKARCNDPERIRKLLTTKQARLVGTDHQIDTYFKVANGGRLKLREGNIENSLIFYRRANQAGPKDSHVSLCTMDQSVPDGLRDVLSDALGELVTVDKQREIYFIDNVKFHLDQVDQLGSFVEIEAIGQAGVDRQEDLLKQCQYYMELLAIDQADLVEVSYSDLLRSEKETVQ